jgi:hypothetical protein
MLYEDAGVYKRIKTTLGEPRDADRMYALCMAQHARLGLMSPARHLSPEVFGHVATFLDEWKVRIKP